MGEGRKLRPGPGRKGKESFASFGRKVLSDFKESVFVGAFYFGDPLGGNPAGEEVGIDSFGEWARNVFGNGDLADGVAEFDELGGPGLGWISTLRRRAQS